MLQHWVRDRSRGPRFSLEEAVRMLTRDPAALFGVSLRSLVVCNLLILAGRPSMGKTSLALRIQERVGAERCLLLAQDAYYKDGSGLSPKEQAAINYDHPEAYDTSLLVQDLRDLKDKNGVLMVQEMHKNAKAGGDIVEYNPDRDVNGMTAAVAAKLLKEIAGVMLAQSIG